MIAMKREDNKLSRVSLHLLQGDEESTSEHNLSLMVDGARVVKENGSISVNIGSLTMSFSKDFGEMMAREILW